MRTTRGPPEKPNMCWHSCQAAFAHAKSPLMPSFAVQIPDEIANELSFPIGRRLIQVIHSATPLTAAQQIAHVADHYETSARSRQSMREHEWTFAVCDSTVVVAA